MTKSNKELQYDIKYVKGVLGYAHRRSTFRFPGALEELRKYVLIVHTEYEITMETLIKAALMNTLNISPATKELFKALDFEKKIKITKLVQKDFPAGKARAINEIRNNMVHKRNFELAETLKDKANLLRVYEDVLDAYESINEYNENLADDLNEFLLN